MEDANFRGTARYEILRCLGRGGMGIVYEARDRERDIRIALKTMRRLDAHMLLRFKQEFRALQGLQHPNLVSLFDLIADGDHWFITMELLDGVNFLRHVRGQPDSAQATTAPPLPTGRADRTTQPYADENTIGRPIVPWQPPAYDEQRLRTAVAQLAAGLAYLHGAGRVHRDVKPSNVLVAEHGRVVLVDFGLVLDQTGPQRTDSLVVGTAEYMAPEQGTQRGVGPAVDCNAVGVMLYEVLAGRLPFAGTPADLLHAKLECLPAEPRRFAPCADDLNTLCMELLALDPAARPDADAIARRIDPRRSNGHTRPLASVPLQSPSASSMPGASFVGRAKELAQLNAAFEQVRRGHSCVVLVEGPSGVGKSALVAHFTQRLQAEVGDVVVLSGRYYEREAVAYRALHAIMDEMACFLMRLPNDAAEAILPLDAGLLANLFPALRGVEAVARGAYRAPALDLQEQRNRVHQAVRELFLRLTRKHPVILVADDVQWSDHDSRAVLMDALRPPEGPALLTLTTLRTSEADANAAERATAFLATLGQLVRIRLGPLASPEAHQLAARLLGNDHRRAAAIAEEAAGHPLFIDALARHAIMLGAEAAGPVRLDDALLARIDALPPTAQHLLELVALAGRPLPEWHAQRALGVELPELGRALSTLRLAHLVRMTRRRDEDAVEPYHDRVRELTCARLDAATQQARHEVLARTLEELDSGDAEALFEHWRAAGDVARNIRYGTLAAARAAEVLAFDRAAQLYREVIACAAESEERRSLHIRLGDALANAGRGPQAAEAYFAAVPGASTVEALELRRRAAEQLLRSGRIDAGLDAVSSVLNAVDLQMPKTPRRALAALLVRRAALRLRGNEFVERAAGELAQSELTRIDICWSVAGVLGMVDTIRGALFQTLHLQLALRAGEPFRVARALGLEAGYSAADGVPSARRTGALLGRARRLAAQCDDPYLHGWITGAGGVAAALEGRWRAAHEQCAAAEEIFRSRCGGIAWELSTFGVFYTYGLAFTGQMAELARRVPRALRDAEERGDLYAAVAHRLALANMAWLVGDEVDVARERIREGVAQWSRGGYQVAHFWALLAEGQLELYCGRPTIALERLLHAWPELTNSLLLRVQLSRVEATQLRGRAALAAATRGSANLAMAKRIAGDLQRERAPWATPLADLLHAGIAHVDGASEEAIRCLRRALLTLEAADMALYAAAARFRLGRLLGGDEGRTLVIQAQAWMASETIVRPERMIAMLAPGFD